MSGDWWREGVVYQVYPRSFADANGDGIGDLPGLTSRLEHIAGLGADAIWLTPFQTSPQIDHGYDVSDYTGVDPLFGDLAAFDALLARAHELGLRVIIDIVPNHCSSAHPVFREALEGSASARERFHFTASPNNWPSVFGGPAWESAGDGTWYLHLYAPSQPDWNWRDPRTAPFFDDVLRFWFDRGVDGMRVDVAHGLFKAPGLPPLPPEVTPVPGRLRTNPLACDQPETPHVFERWREITASYSPERVLIGEVNLPPAQAARYVGPNRLHQAFAFGFLVAPWSASTWLATGAELLEHRPVTWVVENHDVVRTPTRYGSPARARAALLTVLGLPGAAYLYQGQEYGLPEVDVPVEARQDPAWERAGISRDGCRVPLPWPADFSPPESAPQHAAGSSPPSSAPPGAAGLSPPESAPQHAAGSSPPSSAPPGAAGFSPPGSAPPWLPVPAGWDAHLESPTLPLCRKAIALRRSLALSADDPVEWSVDGDDRLLARRPGLTLVVAMGLGPVPMPPGEVLLTSDPLTPDGSLPADAAAWVRTPRS